MPWVKVIDLERFLAERGLLPAVQNCPDCDVQPGHVHNDYCDAERCSVCGRQYFSCGCEGHDKFFARWTGFWPGELECLGLGMLSRWEADPKNPTRADLICAEPRADQNRFHEEGWSKIFFVKPQTDDNGNARAAHSKVPSVREVMADPACSFWLRNALDTALSRDPADAVNDAELLARILAREFRKALRGQ